VDGDVIFLQNGQFVTDTDPVIFDKSLHVKGNVDGAGEPLAVVSNGCYEDTLECAAHFVEWRFTLKRSHLENVKFVESSYGISYSYPMDTTNVHFDRVIQPILAIVDAKKVYPYLAPADRYPFGGINSDLETGKQTSTHYRTRIIDAGYSSYINAAETTFKELDFSYSGNSAIIYISIAFNVFAAPEDGSVVDPGYENYVVEYPAFVRNVVFENCRFDFSAAPLLPISRAVSFVSLQGRMLDSKVVGSTFVAHDSGAPLASRFVTVRGFPGFGGETRDVGILGNHMSGPSIVTVIGSSAVDVIDNDFRDIYRPETSQPAGILFFRADRGLISGNNFTESGLPGFSVDSFSGGGIYLIDSWENAVFEVGARTWPLIGPPSVAATEFIVDIGGYANRIVGLRANSGTPPNGIGQSLKETASAMHDQEATALDRANRRQ
jgi:hypothetical protein